MLNDLASLQYNYQIFYQVISLLDFENFHPVISSKQFFQTTRKLLDGLSFQLYSQLL